MCVCVRVCSVCEVGGITVSFHSPPVVRLTGAVCVRVCSVCVRVCSVCGEGGTHRSRVPRQTGPCIVGSSTGR